MKKLFILLLFILAGTSQINAQVQSVGKGRVFTTEGQTIKFNSLNIGELEHQYRTLAGNTRTLSADKVVRIEQQTGSEAGKWAIIMGLSGLLGSALGVAQAHAQAEAEGTELSHSADAPIIIGLTAVSAGIGAAIGSGKKKYQTVYTNPKYGSVQPQWQLSLLASRQAGGLSLKVSF